MTEESLALEEMKKKQKKNLKVILYVIGGLLLVLLLGLFLLNEFLPKEREEENKRDIYFYPVTDENIFENEQYLSKDRRVHFCDDSTVFKSTSPITDENRAEFGAEVAFCEIYLNTVILGDAKEIRAMCSPSFLEKNSIPDFTQQMLYDMCIYKHSVENLDDGSKLVTCKLMYKFMENNGTYRRDVGSDGAKPEYLVLEVSADGSNIRIHDILR